VFWQSRCPTRLIEAGCRSSVAGAPWGTGVAVGAGGCGVGLGVGVGVGLGVGVGASVATGLRAGADWAVVAAPQAAHRLLARIKQSTVMLHLTDLLG